MKILLVALPAIPALLLLATPRPAQPPLTPQVGGHVTKGDARNAAVMPPQRIDLKFTHRLHVEEVGLGCTDCHAGVPKSKEADDFNVPAKAACMECHDAAEIPVDWDGRSKTSALSMPAAHLHFSHARHLSLGEEFGVTCGTCHGEVPSKDLATLDDLPSMETCLTCHDGKKAPDDCRTCHLSGRGGAIRTTYDSGVLKPDDHGALWLRQHHVEAERDMGLCASCHAQEDCLTCHEGSIPPSFHDGNYVALHPQDAQANNPPCASCHRIDRFCTDCHFRAGVTLTHPLYGGEGFHPPGWTITGDPMHHEKVAKKNIGSCMSCHQGQDCVSCHAFYTGAPVTHPAGWATSRRMERLIQSNPDVCRNCHGLGDPNDPYAPPP